MATKDEVVRRIDEVLQLLAEGKSSAKITEIAGQKWGIRRAAAYQYMAWARERLTKVLDRERAGLVAMELEKRRLLYELAVESGDLELALKVLDSSAKIYGFYATPSHPVAPPLAVGIGIPSPTQPGQPTTSPSGVQSGAPGDLFNKIQQHAEQFYLSAQREVGEEIADEDREAEGGLPGDNPQQPIHPV